MKIFSLQTKKSLVVWSLILGTFSYWLSSKLSAIQTFCGDDLVHDSCTVSGWPLRVGWSYMADVLIWPKYLFNFIIWFLITIAVLSIIRNFTNKKVAG